MTTKERTEADGSAAVWRQAVLDLLSGILESQQRQEVALAQLGAVLVGRRPGGPPRAQVTSAAVGNLRNQPITVGQRAVEIVREHAAARWQRLQLPVLRALDRLHGQATRTELNQLLRCNGKLLTHALAALEADGFIRLRYVKLSPKKTSTVIEATKLADVFRAPEPDAADNEDGSGSAQRNGRTLDEERERSRRRAAAKAAQTV